MVKPDYLKEIRREDALTISGIKDLKRLTAKDAMIKPVFLLPDDDGDKIIKKLKAEETKVCIVVTKDKKFVGEINEEDLIKLFLIQVKYEPLTEILNIGYKRGFAHMRAVDLVNKHKATVELGTPINRVIELVYKEGFQYIPVLDKAKVVKGVVTPSSLLNLLERY
ncbi:MAG: CBS domain-containing protein [Candidatus Altiarchaeota archaeon]|nr:CBS domain-containing protein [Candidatus Altiarchaeota archaeon]